MLCRSCDGGGGGGGRGRGSAGAAETVARAYKNSANTDAGLPADCELAGSPLINSLFISHVVEVIFTLALHVGDWCSEDGREEERAKQCDEEAGL